MTGVEESPAPLLTLLQVQTYPVPFISARVFIMPKLQNIIWRKVIGELFFFYIKHLSNCYSVRYPTSAPCSCLHLLNQESNFREHISRALPTELIFHLLGSIPLHVLHGRRYSAESMFDTLEIVNKWLQVSVIEYNRQNPQTKIGFVFRNLVLSDRATCTIASRVNFFNSNLPQLNLEIGI